MHCLEKEELQRNCTLAWDAYAAEVDRAGLAIEPGSGATRPPAISRLLAGGYRSALRLRGEHLEASRELSLHLVRHRC